MDEIPTSRVWYHGGRGGRGDGYGEEWGWGGHRGRDRRGRRHHGWHCWGWWWPGDRYGDYMRGFRCGCPLMMFAMLGGCAMMLALPAALRRQR